MEMNEGVQKIIEIFQKINTEVPPKTREALDEIGRLDALAKEQSDQVQNLKVQFLANFDKMTTEQKSNAFTHLQTQMEKMLEYSDQKVEISRQMTANLTEMKAQFDAVSTNFIENYPTSSHSESHRTPEIQKTSSSNRKNPGTEEKRRGRKKKEVKREESDDIKQEDGDDGDGEILNEMLDEDDEDRTWCWCQLLKQDEMVCCENPSCKYQWFHFKCIGMVTAPVGDWYCTTDCRNQALKAKKEKKTSKSGATPSTTSSNKRGIKKRK